MLLLLEECLDRCLDGRQICEVQMEIVAVGFACLLLEVCNGRGCLLLGPGGEVDLGILPEEDLTRRFANTSVASSDNDDSSTLIWEVGLLECRLGWL